MTAPLVVANCSGFYGDRLSAMREVLDGGPVDVVTGDWLAELTLLLLGRQQLKDPTAGWARTFLTQLEDCLGTLLERGTKVVANAGGLNPSGLSDAVAELARQLGLQVRVATVSGDGLLPRLPALDVRLGERPPGDAPVSGALTANAYLGCWGVVEALRGGADLVITGRITDASLVVGPAAWHHKWTRSDLQQLAGATVAGHVLECGTQATGGNYSFFHELPADAYDAVGFPLAEIADDGAFVVTKHPGTGGTVTIETVTEQLLYECTGAAYGGPDVVTRFDTLHLAQVGPDRVRVTGAVGSPPSGWLKVATNTLGGWRNTVTLPLTGLQVPAKAALLQRQLAPVLAGIAEVEVVLVRTDTPDAATQEQASALLHISVKDPDRDKVGKAFTAPLVELGLSSIPGFHAGAAPSAPSAYGVYSPAWVSARDVPSVVTLPDGSLIEVPSYDEKAFGTAGLVNPRTAVPEPEPTGPTRRVPLGTVVGARSGDKGGAVTLGAYARSDDAWRWLAAFLTVERLQALLPEARGLPVTRELLPGLRAVLFQVPGLLGQGVAAGTRFDPQGKAVGEWLRSRVVEVPIHLLEEVSP